MLSRHLFASQVKCNFCLEWMSRSCETKFSINVCKSCLHKGYEQDALKAVSSSGQIHILSLVKQNLKSIENFKSTILKDSNVQTDQNPDWKPTKCQEDSDFLRLLNIQIQEIKAKWNIICSFINQKDFLSTEQIQYLKILVSQNAADLNKFDKKNHQVVELSQIIKKQPSQFLSLQNQAKINPLSEICILQSVSNFNRIEIPIKIQGKQNKLGLYKNLDKTKNQGFKIQEMPEVKTLCKIELKQKDLNIAESKNCKLQQLKESNQIQKKSSNAQFFDNKKIFSHRKSKSSISSMQRSLYSPFSGLTNTTITKRPYTEQEKKLEQTKIKIIQFVQTHYESKSLAKLMLSVVLQAYQNTSQSPKNIELVSYNLSFTDFRCYLEAFIWTGIEVLKIVKTKLSDQQFKILIDFIKDNRLDIKVLVLTGNSLTEASLQYISEQNLPVLRQLYLGKNRINRTKARLQTIALENKYSLYM